MRSALARALITATVAASTAVVLAPAATAAVPSAKPSHMISAADTARINHWASTLRRIRTCESSGDYQINTGNGYYGAYQFAAATWHGLGYSGLPNQAAPRTQDAAAARLLSRSGTGSWGACA